MSFNQVSGIVVGATLLVTWWLSRYDSRIIGDSRWPDMLKRFLRCAFTAGTAELIYWCFWRYSHRGEAAYGLVPIPIILVLAFLWSGAVGELVSRGFGKLFDSDGRRAFDPGKGEAGLRQLSELINEGRREEAEKLSEKLKKSGDTNIIVLEAMMQHLGVDDRHVDQEKSVATARKLQAEGRFGEAARVLASLLKVHPGHAEASILLIRIYGQDLGQSGRAAEVFETLRRQPGVSPGMIEFARNLMAEAERPRPGIAQELAQDVKGQSVDELIARKRFGSAIEVLKATLQQRPDDFDLWLKLAEVNGRHCGSMQQVENIIKLLEGDPRFQPGQVQTLRVKLEEWRTEWKMPKTPAKPSEALPVTGKPANENVSSASSQISAF